MKTKVSCVASSLLIGTSAIAGCANYEDGSLPNTPAPVYRVCYDDVCDITTMSYQCANVYSAQLGFANGWALEYEAQDEGDGQKTVSWQGRVIDEAKHHRLSYERIDN